MERHVEITADGSTTICIPDMGVTYHSMHGAAGESTHVFIDAGLQYYHRQYGADAIRILEMGLGTGLNVLLTCEYVKQHNLIVFYESVEQCPLNEKEVAALNYDNKELLQIIHHSAWNTPVGITSNFTFTKHHTSLQKLNTDSKFDVIYYDAFAPDVQPELWTAEIFSKLYEMTATNGVLVTYCSKSIVRRAMMAAGFRIEKIPGPWGKREMVRATKIQ
jgi:tRNA U34 5-methylaminomethyl-2-thiouridine-forming methyltransferase MnmC